MSPEFALYLGICLAQGSLLAVAAWWVERRRRVNRAVTTWQTCLWMIPLTALLLVQWWLSFRN